MDPGKWEKTGEKERIELACYNDANIGATMRVYVVDRPDYLRFSFSATEFYVQQDEFLTIDLNVSAVSGAGSGDYRTVIALVAQTEDGSEERVATFNISVLVPSIPARIGFQNLVIIGVVVGVGVGVAVLWRMGKLKGLKGIKLPKRSKAAGETGE